MVFIIFGKPLVFWLGLITLVSFILQIYLGYRLTHGRSDLFNWHKLNAFILSCLFFTYLILDFLLHFNQ